MWDEAVNYRSIVDLVTCVRHNLFKLPPDLDLVVGVPRSGMLPASVVALSLNLKFCDTSAFERNTPLAHGNTRVAKNSALELPQGARHVLLIDDSVESGRAMSNALELLLRAGVDRVTTCAVYASQRGTESVDVYLELLSQPRAFEWNVMHRELLGDCCVDIDGVLCVDPTPAENDDAEKYREFLLNAKPIVVPTCQIGHLVTSRLEKYRQETVTWLNRHQIKFDELHMLDLPDAQTRRRLGCHGVFKAEVYKSLKRAVLFIESEPDQAEQIANASGKQVLCFKTHQLYQPSLSLALLERGTSRLAERVLRRTSRLLRGISLGG